jgi:hypothetical protein
MTQRLCQCGCGLPLVGGPKQKYATKRCKWSVANRLRPRPTNEPPGPKPKPNRPPKIPVRRVDE